MHRRLRPFVHQFHYRVFSLLVDIDELPVLSRRLRLLSHNRANLLSFQDRDHGPRDGSPLRPWVEARLREAGLAWRPGRLRLLCFPRLLGYVFNPLSIWFCDDDHGRLRAILYEVKNTFGEQHGYLIEVPENHSPGHVIAQNCDKSFYVSPFIAMDCRYRFRLREPGDRLSVTIRQADPQGDLLVASQAGRRVPLDDRHLLAAIGGFPLMTMKVMAAIHWQALKLWLKGARYHRRPPAPANPVSHTPDKRLEPAE